jgi:hypothetical protein
MYNSSLQDLSITASRKVPEFGASWIGRRKLGKFPNVIAKELKDLGVDTIPEDAMKRLQARFDEVIASGQELEYREMGREIVHPDGRKELVAVGYTVNHQPVEKAVFPWFTQYFLNMRKDHDNFVRTTDP